MPIYPSRIPPDTDTTDSERAIFRRAKKSNFLNNDSTFLFHSLNPQKAGKKMRGEVDFIYLDKEFLLFLEVKGGTVRYVANRDKWLTMSGNLEKDPFKQAYKSLFEVRDKVLPNQFPKDYFHQKLKLGIGVLFPDSSKPKEFENYTKKYSGETIEYDLDLMYLAEDHYKENGFDIYLERLKNYWSKFPKYKNHHHGINENDVLKIKNYFRTDLIFQTPLLSYIQEDQKNTQFYTEQQKKVLKQIEANSSHGAIIDGGPGTGKTLIAIERTAELASKGYDVLLLCYNKNLCSYLKSKYETAFPYDQPGTVEIDYLHRLLVKSLREIDIEIDPRDNHKYWSRTLPNQFKTYFPSNTTEMKFDHIVIDEGQDIFYEQYIDSIELFLKDGWESNNWTIFIDSKYQTVYQDFDKQLFKTFKNIYDAYYYQLFDNCRNTKQIIETAYLHTGFKKISCKKDSKVKPSIYQYKSEKDLIVKLEKKIKELTNEGGIPNNWITILCSNSHQDLLIQHDNNKYYRLQDYQDLKSKNKISLVTPYSFKGLENETIIYVAKSKFAEDNKEILKEYYTAYTRSKSNLIIYLPESIVTELDNFVLKNLKDN